MTSEEVTPPSVGAPKIYLASVGRKVEGTLGVCLGVSQGSLGKVVEGYTPVNQNSP